MSVAFHYIKARIHKMFRRDFEKLLPFIPSSSIFLRKAKTFRNGKLLEEVVKSSAPSKTDDATLKKSSTKEIQIQNRNSLISIRD